MKMSSEKLLDRIKKILSEILGSDDIPDDASQNDFTEWDSLAYLSVVAQLESEFVIEISENNINNFGSIPDIIKEIEACQ
jgi:acyl carrier protein